MVANVRRIVEEDESDVGFLVDFRYFVGRQHAEVVNFFPCGQGLQSFHIGRNEATSGKEVAAGCLAEAVDYDMVHIAFVNPASKADNGCLFFVIVMGYLLERWIVGDHDSVGVDPFKSI